MGKRSRNGRGGGRGGGRGRGNKKPRADGKEEDWRADKFADWVYENENFDAYYKAQNIVPNADWDTFKKALATPLPTTFRINSSCRSLTGDIREHIEQDFKFDGLVVDDEPVEPISSMPGTLTTRRRVRKLPILKEFQSWLVELSNSGSITRQEAVSMIPPLVLGVEPHHKVLDMCAAPGSKTSQLLESLHSQEFATGKTPTVSWWPTTWTSNSKRISSPALLVTCHEAQNIPFLGTDGTESEGVFDLVTAHCEEPLIWKNWSAKNGIALHPLQLQIAKRGASLLKVGGNICYSTCTFNPWRTKRWLLTAELVDVSNTLPLLKRRPGISTWKVIDSQLKEYSSYENYVEENMKDKIKDKIRATMFPPTEKEAADLHLERCMRCLPQDENTGGFFICLLKKVAPTPDDKEEPAEGATTKSEEDAVRVEKVKKEAAPSNEATATDAKADPEAQKSASDEAKPRRNRRNDRLNKKGEVYVAFGAENWANVREYYDIAPAFSAEQLITRSEDAKSVTFVTESITMALLEEMKRKKLKVVYAGLKMFERNETAEGGKVYRDFQMMLERLGDLLDFDEFEPATRQYFENAPIGSVVCMLDRPGQSNVESKVMNLVVWRGRNSVNVMAAKADVAVLLGTMKELKIYNPAVQEAVMEAKKVKDEERAARDEKKEVEMEEISVRSAQKLMDHVNFSPLHQASLGLNNSSKVGNTKSATQMRRLLYDGSKLFWRVNETLDLCIYEDTAVNSVTIRAFQHKSPQDSEPTSSADPIPALDIDLRRLRQTLGIEVAPKARRDALDRVNLFLQKINDDEVDPADLLLTTTGGSRALPTDLRFATSQASALATSASNTMLGLSGGGRRFTVMDSKPTADWMRAYDRVVLQSAVERSKEVIEQLPNYEQGMGSIDEAK
ncbi:S-adenosyl-L-methionine-dependent methyltransferase [Phytophthora cactorum]|nr:S-adenosyl-L-methionine-dependent methyltransferase [Phytophthora cactorum]